MNYEKEIADLRSDVEERIEELEAYKDNDANRISKWRFKTQERIEALEKRWEASCEIPNPSDIPTPPLGSDDICVGRLAPNATTTKRVKVTVRGKGKPNIVLPDEYLKPTPEVLYECEPHEGNFTVPGQPHLGIDDRESKPEAPEFKPDDIRSLTRTDGNAHNVNNYNVWALCDYADNLKAIEDELRAENDMLKGRLKWREEFDTGVIASWGKDSETLKANLAEKDKQLSQYKEMERRMHRKVEWFKAHPNLSFTIGDIGYILDALKAK